MDYELDSVINANAQELFNRVWNVLAEWYNASGLPRQEKGDVVVNVLLNLVAIDIVKTGDTVENVTKSLEEMVKYYQAKKTTAEQKEEI